MDLTNSAAIDVLVVGAGPAGSTAARELALQGINVVLADRPPRGLPVDHEVALSSNELPPAPRASYTLKSAPVDRLAVRFDGQRDVTYDEPGLVLCTRNALLGELRRSARDASVRFIDSPVRQLERVGDRWLATLESDDTINVRYVVLAAGSHQASRLLTHAGQPTGITYARRYEGFPEGTPTSLELVPPPPTNPQARPTAARVLPSPVFPSVATVAVTALTSDRHAPACELLDLAVESLRSRERNFSLRPITPVISGLINTSFEPEGCARDGILLVGDAAGLVNPFTGDGLGHAIRSGVLAGRAIAAHFAENDAAERAYTRELTRAFIGYFGTARHAARRYHLAWRMLADSSSSENPFFVKGRRAILLPEGIGGLGPQQRLGLQDDTSRLLVPFLLACNEIAVRTVRDDWPFITSLLVSGQSGTNHDLRPAILFAAATMVNGQPPDNEHALVATAIELAMLGALALLGPASQSSEQRGVDWPAATAIMAGDFLLAQAAAIIAHHRPALSGVFAEWLDELTSLRARACQPGQVVASGTALFGTMFEFPARVGAQLAGASDDVVGAIRSFGYHCGITFLHTEDLLALRNKRTRLDTTLQGLLELRLSALPALLDDSGLTATALSADSRATADALDLTGVAGAEARTAAEKALTDLPAGHARHVLEKFVAILAAPLSTPKCDD
ncbi:lycopene cyclase family protein [Prauserella alba]|uniref:lycopene cyclase family protein n=1 Tax=Prauserella alba TaxID=176898 RepID=UPI0020A29C97|nr:NAD(P)/FAD-dependent oxidoreductase [Prauserella alba]